MKKIIIYIVIFFTCASHIYGKELNNLNKDFSSLICNSNAYFEPKGEIYKEPIDVGIYSDLFLYSDNQQTTDDVFYKFIITKPMTISITGNSLGVEDADHPPVHLCNSLGQTIDCSRDSYYSIKDNLPIGIYYVYIEGTGTPGVVINTEIKGIEVFENYSTGNSDTQFTPIGEIYKKPINAGSYSWNFAYADFQQTINDLFYKFEIEGQATISIKGYSIGVEDADRPYVHLCNSKGSTIYTNNNDAVFVENLPAGLYYIKIEGTGTENIIINIEIRATKMIEPVFPNDSSKKNIVKTITPTISGIDNTNNLNSNNSMQSVQYYDGLGRPIQTIQVAATPNRNDIVTMVEYDVFGRESTNWLPVSISNYNGRYVNQHTVKRNSTNLYNDKAPYSQIIYENSPLNRVVERYGAGQDWYDDDKSVSSTYLFNKGTSGLFACIKFKVSGAGINTKLEQNGYYGDGMLYVMQIIDEDGNASYEFKDKLGQVILIRQVNNGINHDTYYVYNNLGSLCFVLPPRINDEGITQVKLNELAYQYKYDDRNRCIWKKLPGCEPVLYVYDYADRLIFTQDGEQRTKGEWLFSIPDVFGRTIITGKCKNSMNYAANPLGSNIVKVVRANANNTYKGYATPTGVTLTTPTILSVNYYDDYAFIGYNGIPNSDYANYNAESGYATRYTGGYKGLLTGTLTAQQLPDGTISSTYLYSVMYYDSKQRLIQTKSNNHLTGGYEKEYIAYNFTGQPVKRKHVHMATGKNTQTEVYAYSYDHVGRLLKTTHQLTDGTSIKPQVVLAENSYDELGRLKTNKKGGQANLNTTYTYNVRSWTNSITSYHFNETLSYTHNGNIKTMQWSQAQKTRKYTYSYDNLSRLKNATYTGDGNFSTAYTYDKHGNMMTLQRYGLVNASTHGLIDNLTMTYTGNQMKTAKDAVADIALNTSMDFKDYSNTATEYTYNTNGAMTKDLNKGISQIQYNNLNLPRIVDIKNKNAEGRNEYTYSASGQKLKAVQKWNPNYSTSPVIGSTVNTAAMTQTHITDYAGNKIYENNALKRILVDGGYYETGNYYFYISDHLGNNRIVANAAASVVQTTQYYPFGSSFADASGSSTQPYKYNGKELDTRNGLNMYDYSARWKADWYFPTVDPKAENDFSWSPYVYTYNNPLRFTDPTGMTPNDSIKDGGSLNQITIEGTIKTANTIAYYSLPMVSFANDADRAWARGDYLGWAGNILMGTGDGLLFAVSLGSSSVIKGGVKSLAKGGVKAGTRGLWVLSKKYAASIKSHKKWGTFYKSKSDGLWWVVDKTKHGGSEFKVFKETNKGLEWIHDADKYGDFITNKHKSTTGTFIPFGELTTVL